MWHRPISLYILGGWNRRVQRPLDPSQQFRVRALTRLVRNRKPCLPAIAVQQQGGRFLGLAEHQQDHHLTVALLCAVMRAGTIAQSRPRGVQVEGLHGAQSRPRQAFLRPTQGFVAGTVDGQERGNTHKRLGRSQ